MKESIILLLLGTAAGFLSGLLGIGGGVVVIPALMLLLGYSQTMAQGTTLLMMVFPVGALAAWAYWQQGQVQVKAALLMAVAFFVSGYFGAKAANVIPQETLKKTFAVFLILIALKMLFWDKTPR